MVALLAAEKRPGTTEWEKHADHLSKTRKMNEFKGGGKFRRFGPPIQPTNYHKPIESLRRTLVEDDSCYSDAYYNSHSSPQHSTASDSPRLRRARLPINGVLAANAKRMQREFATFVSNRRKATSALRSLTVSPAFGRHFDYNPQRPRISSPTPSIISYTRSGYSTPVIMNPELQPSPRAASWKRGAASSRLHSPPSHFGRALRRVIEPLDPQLAANVISQSKLKSTKAFTSLRSGTSGRTRIFGQTRSGSPVNRRVFARRSGSPPTSKGPILYARSSSPERVRALIQNKVERKNKAKHLAETPTKIKLEREASIKESKEVNEGKLPTNGFSLSKALSPIKMAAETHSLPHLQSEEHKTTFVAHSLKEVVEQAVEHAKNGGDTLDVDVKKYAQNVEASKIKKETPVKHERQKKMPENSANREKKNERKKNTNEKSVDIKKDAENEKSPSSDLIKRGSESNIWHANNDTSNSIISSSRSKKLTPSPMRGKFKKDSTVDSKENNNMNKHTSEPSPSKQKRNSPQDIDKVGDSAIRGSFSTSPNKKHTYTPAHNERTHSRSLAPGANLNTKGGSTQNPGEVCSSTPILKQRDKGESRLTETRSLINNIVRVNNTQGDQINRKSKTGNNNGWYSNQNNWNNSSRRNSKVEYTNISNRFEYNANLSSLRREKNPSRANYNTSSLYHDKQGPKEVDKQNYISKTNEEVNNLANKVHVNDSFRGTQHNPNYANKINHDEQSFLLFNENLSNIENIKYGFEDTDGSKREIQINAPRTNKNSPGTNSTISREQNNNKYKLEPSGNHIESQKETRNENDNLSNNHTNNEEKVQNKQTPIHQTVNSPIKQLTDTITYSPRHNSHNSSSSKSSKSSTSIVIHTNFSTPETEDFDEETLNRKLSQHLEQLKHYDEETIDEQNLSQQASIEEDSQIDLDDYSRTDHDESSRTDPEETQHTDADIISRTDMDIYSAASTSMEDLINTPSPQTAYLNLGRSATMTSLKPKTPILDNPSHSSSYVNRRHSSSYESDQLEKVLFVAELSSMARTRSARVPSPYKMRDRCDVCYNKYVIK